MEKKYRIGLFIDNFYPIIDGAIIVVDSISKILKKSAEIIVFTAAPRNGIYDDSKLEYKVIRCRSEKIPFVKRIAYDRPVPNKDKEFKRMLEESALDLVHINSPFAVGEQGLEYAKQHNVPSVITLHSQYKQDFYKATHSRLITAMLMRRIMKVFNECDECWSVNEASKQVLYEYGINKEPVTMENGTDMFPVIDRKKAMDEINKDYNINEKQKVMLFVGRLVTVKNIFFIADVLKVLKEQNFDFKMIFIGDGPAKEELQKKLNEHGIADNVIFTGFIKDREEIAKFYVRADLFMFPSFYDTDGIVKKEAACQKTPIICAEGSIVAKSVFPDHNAYVAPNNAAAFADKIIKVFEDPKEYNEICENAYNELYITWEKTAKNILDRYKFLIESY